MDDKYRAHQEERRRASESGRCANQACQAAEWQPNPVPIEKRRRILFEDYCGECFARFRESSESHEAQEYLDRVRESGCTSLLFTQDGYSLCWRTTHPTRTRCMLDDFDHRSCPDDLPGTREFQRCAIDFFDFCSSCGKGCCKDAFYETCPVCDAEVDSCAQCLDVCEPCDRHMCRKCAASIATQHLWSDKDLVAIGVASMECECVECYAADMLETLPKELEQARAAREAQSTYAETLLTDAQLKEAGLSIYYYRMARDDLLRSIDKLVEGLAEVTNFRISDERMARAKALWGGQGEEGEEGDGDAHADL